MLTDQELELVQAATTVIRGVEGGTHDNASHTDNHSADNHSVAAAAYDCAGTVFIGVNVFHFTGGPCAEPVLMGQAVASGTAQLPLTTIVAVLDGERGVIPPCGRCRQMLFDYYPGIRAIVRGKNGLESAPITDLLPYAFDWRAYEPGATQTMYLYEGYLAAIRAGEKTSTIRVHDPFHPGPCHLVFDHADEGTATSMDADITRVDTRSVAELTDEDAVRDGFADRQALLDALSRHYPGLGTHADVDIVHFTTAT